ncbi:MAG: NUDIX hydrolase [Anaerolineae bacterium]|nr:NUDIX hydrolase [Anaerolineae bacterium]
MQDMNPCPKISTADGRRAFACFPAAVVVILVNENEEILLLSHPKRQGWWEVVNGALEAGESVLAGALRETSEEAGPAVRVRPLGTVHVQSFHFDENVRYMISVSYLMAYEGGQIQPGDDMRGSQYRWWKLDELRNQMDNVIVPGELWILDRAVELYRLWKDREVKLQPELNLSRKQQVKALGVVIGDA